MYIRVLCTIIYQSDDLALSASDRLDVLVGREGQMGKASPVGGQSSFFCSPRE